MKYFALSLFPLLLVSVSACGRFFMHVLILACRLGPTTKLLKLFLSIFSHQDVVLLSVGRFSEDHSQR